MFSISKLIIYLIPNKVNEADNKIIKMWEEIFICLSRSFYKNCCDVEVLEQIYLVNGRKKYNSYEKFPIGISTNI